jgi:hypothetical protein
MVTVELDRDRLTPGIGRYQLGSYYEMTIRNTARKGLITVFGFSSEGSHFVVDQSRYNNQMDVKGMENQMQLAPKAVVT